MADKKDKQNPFGLLKKESRTLAATVGTEALNNDNYKTSSTLEPDAVVTPPVKLDNSNTEQSESKAARSESVKPTPVESSTVEPTTVEPTPVQSAPTIFNNTVDSVFDKESQNSRVGGEPEKKEVKVKKKPGPKKGTEDEATTVTRISVRGNKLLNLLAKIEDKNHITFLDDLLMTHPLYSKVKPFL